MNVPSFPWRYERYLVEPLFKPLAELLLTRAGLKRGQRVLDVACGTGIVARLARQRVGAAAAVVGVDVSARMLEVAREIEPGGDWRQGDAAALPIGADEKFDVVLCQQGIQFFKHRNAAARELKRVTAPGGTLFAAVWRPVHEMPVFASLQRVAERHVGPIHDERYSFGDAEALHRLLCDARFRDVRVEQVSYVSRFADGAGFVRMNAMALVGMSGAKPAEDEREALLGCIVTDSMEALRPFVEGDTLACETRSNIAIAR